MKPLQPGASREEVLAAVVEHERRRRALEDDLRVGRFDGICCGRGPIEEDPSLALQREAGEEDQSVQGWDSGP